MESSENVEMERLLGVWMHEFSNEDETIESTISFIADGTYIIENRRVQSSEGFNPGLIDAYKGKFSLEAGKLTFSDKIFFFTEDFVNPPATIEALRQGENVKYPKQTAKVSFEENNKVMVLLYDCPGPEPEEDEVLVECLDLGPLPYNQVKNF
ncbi:hypothetical protein NK987_05470 [Aquiflexum sp. XJ19-10]|nr:hypothetical protein [Aquiflexum gelatinilyticum]